MLKGIYTPYTVYSILYNYYKPLEYSKKHINEDGCNKARKFLRKNGFITKSKSISEFSHYCYPTHKWTLNKYYKK